MSLVSLLKGKGANGFGYGSTAEDVTVGLDLRGQNVLVTGATSGLGLETARVLCKRGATVIATARSLDKAEALRAQLGDAIRPVACELTDLRSVLACVESLGAQQLELDAIICNAGVMALPVAQQVHGYEAQFFGNHIGHFLLVTRLLGRLRAQGRVVVVSSSAHRNAPRAGIEFDNLSGERRYAPWTAYGQSKLANILFVKQLAQRLHGTWQTANALHPGVIYTSLGRHLPAIGRAGLALSAPLFLKSAAEGAATQCYLATHPSLAQVSGEYFQDCNVAVPSPAARDPELAARLWQESERIVAEVLAKSA